MIDEWCEAQIDRLCAFMPAYFGPRFTRFCSTGLGWRLYLYASGFKRAVIDRVASVQWIEKAPPEEAEAVTEMEDDPDLERLDPQLREEMRRWNAEQKEWQKKQEEDQHRRRSLTQRMKDRRSSKKAREAKSEAHWLEREKEAQEKAGERMKRLAPLMRRMQESRFAVLLLLTLLAAMGVLAAGGHMGYMAAGLCAMWLSTAFETGYAPIAGGVRQRYLAALLLRGAGFLAFLPHYFGRYVALGVQSNVILQSAMLVLGLAHAVFYLALVAFNGRQPLLLRALSGVVGMGPALTAAAAIALAVAHLAQPLPVALAGIAGAVGALLAFSADRLISITELGGIRLRYTPIWVNAFLEIGLMLMVIGAWLG